MYTERGIAVMIYTWGYGNYSQDVLKLIIKNLKIEKVIDVRSSPFSQWQTVYNTNMIRKWLPCEYTWRGGLGGRCTVQDSALEYLISEGEKREVIIMCAEKDYRTCHRHTDIAKRLFTDYKVNVNHIVNIDGGVYMPSKIDFFESQQALGS